MIFCWGLVVSKSIADLILEFLESKENDVWAGLLMGWFGDRNFSLMLGVECVEGKRLL